MDTTQSQTTNREAADTVTAQGGAPHTCCGGPAPSGTSACCALDAEVKSAGGTGCGCGSAAATRAQEVGVLRVTPFLVIVGARLRLLAVLFLGAGRDTLRVAFWDG